MPHSDKIITKKKKKLLLKGFKFKTNIQLPLMGVPAIYLALFR